MNVQRTRLLSSICLLTIAGLISCHGQTEPKKSQEVTQTIPPRPVNTSDYDPYFIETKYIESDYGPLSITRNILQAKDGNIWLATWEGIVSYDGERFTNHTNKNSLRRWHVFSVMEDSRGNIWFGTIGAGMYVLMGGNTFENLNTSDGLAYDRTGCIYEDTDGVVWIGTERGISRFDGHGFSNYYTPEGGDSDDINTIIQDDSGSFWIGSRGYAHTFDGWNTFTKITREDGSPFTNVRSIIMDKKGDIWLGGNDGLWRYNGEKFTQIETNFTGYIFEDSKGNIWTSSEGQTPGHWKLSRYDAKNLTVGVPRATEILAEENMFFGIEEDADGGIWIGHLRGVYRYNGITTKNFGPSK